MSIDYQNHSDAVELANQMEEEYNLGNTPDNAEFVDAEFVDAETVEVAEE
jgi:hypothetical protein